MAGREGKESNTALWGVRVDDVGSLTYESEDLSKVTDVLFEQEKDNSIHLVIL